jgi:hypothetical protein
MAGDARKGRCCAIEGPQLSGSNMRVDGLIRLREGRLRLRRSGFRRNRVEPIVGITLIDVDLRIASELVTETSSVTYPNGQCRENRLRLKHGTQRPLGSCQASSLSAFLVVSSRQLVAPGGGGAASIDANCASTPAAGVQQESLP